MAIMGMCANQVAEASSLDTWRTLRDGRGTLEQYQHFLKKHSDWPDKANIIAAGEKAILESTISAKRDAAWFDHNPPTTSSGYMRYVEVLIALHRKNIADVVKSAWRNGIDTLDERTFQGKWGKHLTQQDHTERQYRLMLNGSSSPVAQKKDAKIYACAEAYPRIKEHLKARRYAEAETLLREQLPKIRSAQPRMPDVWWKVCHAVARECIERGDYQVALEFVVEHDLLEGTEDWASAEWTRGWLLWHTERYAEAYRTFTNVYNKVKAPMSRARMAFWAAESAKRAHMEEQVVEWHKKSADYGLTFYGQLSARYLKQPVGDLFWPNHVSADASVKKDDIYRVITGKEELSKEEKLLFFSAWVKRLHRSHTPCDTIFAYAVQLAKKKGGDPLAVAIMRLVNFVCPKLVRSAFPTLPGVSPDVAVLANAIAWRESGFDPEIVSSAGAVGLMQMMPGTFEKEKRGMPSPTPQGNVYNPVANVAVGTFLIKRLMQQYPHILLVLCAYNAGENPADRWRDIFGAPPAMDSDPVEIADWIEKIPYYETRNYVQRVLEKMYVYQQVIKGKAVA